MMAPGTSRASSGEQRGRAFQVAESNQRLRARFDDAGAVEPNDGKKQPNASGDGELQRQRNTVDDPFPDMDEALDQRRRRAPFPNRAPCPSLPRR